MRSSKEMFALKENVANVCFRCFRGMLQAFYIDVAKVDQDVAYFAMVVHIYYKCLLPMFYLCFQTYVTSVFIFMLHMFHVYIACVLFGCFVCLQRFSSIFRWFFSRFQKHVASVRLKYFSCFQTYVASVLSECCICCSVATHMFQMFHLF